MLWFLISLNDAGAGGIDVGIVLKESSIDETVVMCSRGKIITWCRMSYGIHAGRLVNAMPIGARSAAAEGSGTVYVHIHGRAAEVTEN